jgi:hypothetical protein
MVNQSAAVDSQGCAVFLSFQNFDFFLPLLRSLVALAANDRWRYRR